MKSPFLPFNCFIYYSTHFCLLLPSIYSFHWGKTSNVNPLILTIFSVSFFHFQTQDKNMPTFSNLGKNWYSDTVPENIELHSPLSVQIQATSPMSRKLIYSIVKGNELEEFAVDFNTGMLRLFLLLLLFIWKLFSEYLFPSPQLFLHIWIHKPQRKNFAFSIHHAPLIVTLIFTLRFFLRFSLLHC